MRTGRKTAAMVAIGDELLSGRTRDANIYYLANWLTARGIELNEVRVVSDTTEAIAKAVNDLRTEVEYVFTSGGIGPTHDDITAESIATAFRVPIDVNEDALAAMRTFYDKLSEEITPGRLRMARVPEGATLIHNTVSGPPGFQIENVFVMAGVPAIFQGMLIDVDARLEHGPVSIAWTVRGPAIESILSEGLENLQNQNKEISIGSYPGKSGQRGSVSVVVRGLDGDKVKLVAEDVLALMTSKGFDAVLLEGDGSTD